MKRPAVIVTCAADRNSDKARERIVEFFDPETKESGLISIRRRESGVLNVSVFCVTERVKMTHQRYRSINRKGTP